MLEIISNSIAVAEEKTLLSSKPVLRYPGGKFRAVEMITTYFPKDLKKMVSPFFGGGSIELFCAAKGIKVLGFDIFQPLVEFWQCLSDDAENISQEVAKYHPLHKKDFYQLQKDQVHLKTKLERAAAFYVLNRSSFSGSTLSGGMSPGHPRFTKTSIERLRQFYNPNVQVQLAHFTESLAQHENVFAYLDPPYLINCSLYGKKGDAHKNFDHVALANILKRRKSWILSYNNCDEICALYKGFKIEMPEWKYGMSNNKSSKEVLIFSADLS